MGISRSGKQVTTLFFLTFVLGTSEFMVMGILPDISEGLGVEYSMVGGLISVFAICYAISTPILSGAIERYDRFHMIMLMMALFLISDIWTMVAWDYWSFLLSRIMTAAVSGVTFSLCIAIIIDLVPKSSRAGSIAWIYVGFNMSSIVGVPMSTVICNGFGWRSVFLFVLVLILVSMLLLFVFIPHSMRREPVEGAKGSRDMLKDPRIILGSILTLFTFGGSYVVFTYLTPIFEDVIGFPDETVGIGLMCFGVMCMISNLIAGRLSNMGGLRIGRYTYAIQLLVLLTLPTALSSSTIGFVAIMTVGLLMYIMNSSTQMLLADVATRDYPGSVTLASALNPAAFNIGIAAGSFVGGVIYDGPGIMDLGYGAAAFIAVSLVLTFVLCRMCRRPGMETAVT